MPKGRKRTKEEYDKEIIAAAKRIGKKREARQAAKGNTTWINYLLDVLNVNPDAVESDAGSKFWKSVREEISPPLPAPTQRQLTEARATVYQNPETRQVSYRASTGRFVKRSDIIEGRIIGF